MSPVLSQLSNVSLLAKLARSSGHVAPRVGTKRSPLGGGVGVCVLLRAERVGVANSQDAIEVSASCGGALNAGGVLVMLPAFCCSSEGDDGADKTADPGAAIGRSKTRLGVRGEGGRCASDAERRRATDMSGVCAENVGTVVEGSITAIAIRGLLQVRSALCGTLDVVDR